MLKKQEVNIKYYFVVVNQQMRTTCNACFILLQCGLSTRTRGLLDIYSFQNKGGFEYFRWSRLTVCNIISIINIINIIAGS